MIVAKKALPMDLPKKHRHWSEAELEKLRSLAGKRSSNEIAHELRRPRGAVVTKAHELKVSLRRGPQQRNVPDPGPAGWELNGKS